MSKHLHPGVHPDADTLSAFVEGVLPEHERAHCLAHLAECSRCREVVFLAGDASVAPAPTVLVPAPWRRRWFWPAPLIAAAATVCVAVLGVWLYLRSRTAAPPRDLVAHATQAPSSTPAKPAETPAPQPIARKAIAALPRRGQPEPKPEEPAAAPVTVSETAPMPPPPAAAAPANRSEMRASAAQTAPPAPQPPSIVVQTEPGSAGALSGISGTVTDPTGAAVSQATVQLRRLASNTTTNARTDQAGQFKFADLPPGPYELQITAPGFMRASQRVELHAREVAAVKSELQIGSATETVEVTAATPTLQTSSAQMSTSGRKAAARPEPRPLPSKLPAETTVTSGKAMLAVDSAGALFYSGNYGKGWKAVKPQWPGKIVDLVTPPEVPDSGSAQFQLTTDSGAYWLSRDGRHWYPAPPQH
jgi:carboxypeptidase family protein/putative zinc finger protein